MKVEWNTLVGSLTPQPEQDEIILPGIYTIHIDTFNGDWISFRDQYKRPLEIRDSYTMIGGHIVHNGYLNGEEVIVGKCSFQARAVVYNYPHNFRLRSKP